MFICSCSKEAGAHRVRAGVRAAALRKSGSRLWEVEWSGVERSPRVEPEVELGSHSALVVTSTRQNLLGWDIRTNYQS